MTGRHEFKSGVTHTILERERMALSAKTLPEALQKAGYKTGIFGKWHLGDQDPYQPGKRGFDEVFIHGAGGIGQTYQGSCGDAPGNSYFDPAIRHNGTFVKTKGYCTDTFFDRAMAWIGEQSGTVDRAPFYCHIATNTPHAPLISPDADEKKYADKVDPKVAKFFGMIANIDDNVGRLLAKLTELGIENDTVVIFMTDNGGTAGCKLFNAGMRGTKGTPYLGGIHVPCSFRWPGVLKPAEVSALTAHIDYFPTLAEIAGAKLPAGVELDGRSLVPLLKSADADWPDRNLFTHRGRWPTGKAAESKYLMCSVRNSRFQLVSADPKAKKAWQLFDLQNDYGQTEDVSKQFPAVAAELEAAYDKWWDSVQDGITINTDAALTGPNTFKAAYWEQFPDERPKK